MDSDSDSLRPKIFLLATFLLAICQLQPRHLIRRCIFLTISDPPLFYSGSSYYIDVSFELLTLSLLVPTDLFNFFTVSLLAPADTPYTLDPQASLFA